MARSLQHRGSIGAAGAELSEGCGDGVRVSEQATICQRSGRGAGFPIPGSGVLSPWPFCAAHPWPCCPTGGCSLLPSPHGLLSALLSSPQQPLFCAMPQDPSSFLLPASSACLHHQAGLGSSCVAGGSLCQPLLSGAECRVLAPALTQSRSGKPCASGVSEDSSWANTNPPLGSQQACEGETDSRGTGPLGPARDSVTEGSWLSPTPCWHYYSEEPVMPLQGALASTVGAVHLH